MTAPLDLLFRPGQSLPPGPVQLGRRMAALYRIWSTRAPDDLAQLALALLQPLGAAGTPLGQACLEAAHAVARSNPHPYHSAQHHAEVAMNAMVIAHLALPAAAPPGHMALLLAAALGHDLGYTPGRPATDRFGAELASADATDRIAARHGVARSDRDDLRTLIIATEPGFRAELTLLALHQGTAACVPPMLQALRQRPHLVPLAAMLSDADMLSSAGLTIRWHHIQVARLERELRLRIAPGSDLRFFDTIVGARFLSPGGHHFTPNIAPIRHAVATSRGPQ